MRLPAPKFGEDSCEEQCKKESVRDDAACDEAVMDDAARGLCHQSVRARHDVCLRICEE
jgi:hypothetical protein